MVCKLHAIFFCTWKGIVKKNQLTLSDCCKRRLDETYITVYAIKNEINIKKGDYIEKSNIYTLIGIDTKGYRQFLNIYQDRINNNRFWLDCFESLKSRGLKNILFLSVDDNKNLKRTAKIAFPDIIFVDSLTDIIPKFYKYSPERDARRLACKLHLLYTQKTLTDCKDALKNFSELYNNVIQQKLISKYLSNIESLYKYSQNIRFLLFKHSANMEFYDRIRLSFNSNNNYSKVKEEANFHLDVFRSKYGTNQRKIVKKAEEFMQYLEPLFELPAEIRACIYTTNAIESVNSALRKVTRGKGAFPSESAVYKVLYLRIKELSLKWNKPIKNWITIRKQLISLFR